MIVQIDMIDARRLVNPFTSLWVTTALDDSLKLLHKVVGHLWPSSADPYIRRAVFTKTACRFGEMVAHTRTKFNDCHVIVDPARRNN
jgi:hypothetical protein